MQILVNVNARPHKVETWEEVGFGGGWDAYISQADQTGLQKHLIGFLVFLVNDCAAITSGPKRHRVQELAEFIEEPSTVGHPTSLGKLLGVLLESRYFSVFDAGEAINMYRILLQSTRELLVGPRADTEDRKVSSNFVVVPGVFIRIEVVLVFFDGRLLIES